MVVGSKTSPIKTSLYYIFSAVPCPYTDVRVPHEGVRVQELLYGTVFSQDFDFCKEGKNLLCRAVIDLGVPDTDILDFPQISRTMNMTSVKSDRLVCIRKVPWENARKHPE